MVCFIEVSLLQLTCPGDPIALECQVSTSPSHAVLLDSPTVQVSVKSFTMPFAIQLVANGTVLASVLTTVEELFQHSSETRKTFTFSVENDSQTVQARFGFKLLASSVCRRCDMLEQTVKDLQEELNNLVSPVTDDDMVSESASVSTLNRTIPQPPEPDSYLRDENKQLKSLLEKSYEARQEMQELIRETTEQMNEEVHRLNKRIHELTAETNTLNKTVVSKDNEIASLELDLHDTQSQNQSLKKEVEELAALPVSSSVVKTVDLSEYYSKLEEYDTLLAELTDDKFFLNNEVLRLKEELANRANDKSELLTLKHQVISLKQGNADLVRENEKIVAELAKAQANLDSVSTHNAELKQNYDDLQELFQSNAAARDDLQLAYENLQEAQLSKEQELVQKDSDLARVKKECLGLQSELVLARQEAKQSSIAEQIREEIERTNRMTQDKLNLYTEELENYRSLNKKLTEKVADLHTSLVDTSSQLETVQLEKEEALADVAKMEQYLCVNEDLNQVIDDLKSQNSAYESANNKLAEELTSMSDIISVQSKRNQASNNKIKKLANELTKKEQELLQLKLRVTSVNEQNLYIPCADDPIDVALAEYVNTQHPKAAVKFTREDPGIYTYGTKKVFIKLEQGRLIIRVGGGYMQIDEFLEIYTPAEIEKLEYKTRVQRHTVAGRTVDSLTPSSSGDLTPKQAAKAVREQISQGKFTMMYAVQRRPATPNKSKEPHRTKRANSFRKLSESFYM